MDWMQNRGSVLEWLTGWSSSFICPSLIFRSFFSKSIINAYESEKGDVSHPPTPPHPLSKTASGIFSDLSTQAKCAVYSHTYLFTDWMWLQVALTFPHLNDRNTASINQWQLWVVLWFGKASIWTASMCSSLFYPSHSCKISEKQDRTWHAVKGK